MNLNQVSTRFPNQRAVTVREQPSCRPAPRRRRNLLLAILSLSWLAVCAAPVAALPACTAADVSSLDVGCPSGVGPCLIAEDFEIGDACVLDFGTRDVTIASISVVRAAVGVSVGMFTIRAGSLTIAGGGSIEARGDGTGNLARGGVVTLITSGAVVVERSGSPGRIDASGREEGGGINIRSGGAVTIGGRVVADGILADSDGGQIEVVAGTDIVGVGGSQISAVGGTAGVAGGDIDFDASGAIRLAAALDVTGADGGTIDIKAGGAIEMGGAQSTANGNGGSGGCIDIASAAGVRLSGSYGLRGKNANDDTSGGCGGNLVVTAERGDIAVDGEVNCNGGPSDGAGGVIGMETNGALRVAAGVSLSAAGAIGRESCGGTIELSAAKGLESFGNLDVGGGAGGGSIELASATGMSLDGTISADGAAAGALGGSITIEAGRDGIAKLTGTGRLVLNGLIDAGGGGCSASEDCGDGGDIDVAACEILANANATILARAGNGGTIDLRARHRLTNNGRVDATRTSMIGSLGKTSLTYPPAGLSPSTGGDTQPSPSLRVLPLCTAAGQDRCLVPCPTCGDGVVSFPEGCDDNNTSDCDGCSALCELQDCNDALLCTNDFCDPQFGCYHSAAPTPCIEPPTRTPTITLTPTISATPTITPTETLSPTPSTTPSITLTPRESPTPTLTPTTLPSATSTPTASASRSATASLTPTATSTATVSPTPVPAGDANCDTRITAADYPALVEAIAKRQPICGADANADGNLDAVDLAVLTVRIFVAN